MSDQRPQRNSIRMQGGMLIGIYVVAMLVLIGRALQVPLTVITEPYIAMGAYLAVVVSCLVCMVMFSSERGGRFPR